MALLIPLIVFLMITIKGQDPDSVKVKQNVKQSEVKLDSMTNKYDALKQRIDSINSLNKKR